MRLILLVLIVILMVTVILNAKSTLKEKNLREKFDEFKKNFKDDSGLDDEERFKNFAKNSDFIDSMNEKHGGQVKFEINKFADRDPEVQLKKMNGAKPPKHMSREMIVEKRRETKIATTTRQITTTTIRPTATTTIRPTTTTTIRPTTTTTIRPTTTTTIRPTTTTTIRPTTTTTTTTNAPTTTTISSTTKSLNNDALDWRTFNIVTPVRDQGYCGSCWAFASLAALESLLIKSRNENSDLSEQNLVDCDINNYGCNGGYIDYAFDYIKNGIMNEANYPYTGKDEICKFNSTKSAAKLTSYSYFNYETNLENALINYGPIVTLLEVTNEFYSYSSGVMTGSLCTTGINHAVTVVGFNNTATPPYWIVKNSWGPDWGENGYFRIKKGSLTCDFGLYNYRPIL